MERLRFRSTSIADLQAELRQRDLLEGAERVRRRPVRPGRRSVFRFSIGWRRRERDPG